MTITRPERPGTIRLGVLAAAAGLALLTPVGQAASA